MSKLYAVALDGDKAKMVGRRYYAEKMRAEYSALLLSNSFVDAMFGSKSFAEKLLSDIVNGEIDSGSIKDENVSRLEVILL